MFVSFCVCLSVFMCVCVCDCVCLLNGVFVSACVYFCAFYVCVCLCT